MLAADKKRPKDERDFVHKFRPYAKLQTAEDYEGFVDGMLRTVSAHLLSTSLMGFADESVLRRRIQELQHYRRLGLTSSADVEKYESDLFHRVRTQSTLLPISCDFDTRACR